MADPLAVLGEHRDEALDVAESARYLLAADGATRRRALLPRLAAGLARIAGLPEPPAVASHAAPAHPAALALATLGRLAAG